MQLRSRVSAGIAGLVVAGGAAAAALLGPAGLAVGQSSQPIQIDVQVNSPATLVARGAGINVPVTVTCSGPDVPNVAVGLNVTERAGSDVAVGIGAAGFDCTGTSQTSLVLVTPTFGGFPSVTAGKAFKKGTAIVQTSASACTADFSICANPTIAPTIITIK